MSKGDLSRVSSRELLAELSRRLEAIGESRAQHLSNIDSIVPAKNSTVQQMVRSLEAGVRRGQAFEVLKFLIANQDSPQTMAQIAAHMKRLRYSATRYYDASNALVRAGYAEATRVGFDRAWVPTAEGLAFAQKGSQ